MRRKGLEPLIAVTLLLVFTLTIATIIISWASPFTKEHRETTEKETAEISECLGMAIDIKTVYSTSGEISKIDIQNTGTKDALLTELRMIGTNEICTLNFDSTNSSVAVGDIKSVLTNNCNINCSTYQSTTLETTCKDIRSIHLKSEKISGC